MRTAITLLLAELALVWGCSRELTRLGDRIASADRVVGATQSGKPMLSKTGDEAAKIVRALLSGRRDRDPHTAMFNWRLHFYRGSNLLYSVRFQDRLFVVENSVYSDDSGVVKRLWDEILADPHRPTD